jgi:hypothetical protein
MTYRNLLLAACICTGVLVAFCSVAMPFDAFERNSKSTITLIDDDGDDNEDQREASNDRGDDDDDCGANGGATQPPQSATPPANGLFAPGSKPSVQTN